MSRANAKEWFGGVVSMPAYVMGEGEAYRPDVLVWANHEDGVVGFEATRPGDPLDAAVECFRRATRAPLAGRPHVPARVRVASAELAAALGEALRGETRVVCAPTPEIDHLAESMREFMKLNPASEPSYVGGDVDAAMVAAFFDAAADLHRAAPWKVLPGDAHVLSLTIEALDVRDYAVSVIGQSGESFGVLLFATLERFEELLDVAEESQPRVVPPHFAINFERGAEVEPALRKEIAKYGWRVAGADAYPWPVVVDEDVVGRPPDAEELVIAEATARALAGAMKHKRAIQRACAGEAPFEHTAEVTTHAGTVSVTLRVPYARAETPDLLGALAALSNDDEIDHEARSRLEASCSSALPRRPKRRTSSCKACFDLVTDYAADYHGVTLPLMSAAQLRDVVFEIVPRKVSMDAESGPPLVDELRALLAFMKREFGWSGADPLLGVLDPGAGARLERALSDPRKFGMAKSMFMAGRDAGHDMQSEEGINEWFSRLQTSHVLDRLQPCPSSRARPPAEARRKGKNKRKAERKARRKNR